MNISHETVSTQNLLFWWSVKAVIFPKLSWHLLKYSTAFLLVTQILVLVFPKYWCFRNFAFRQFSLLYVIMNHAILSHAELDSLLARSDSCTNTSFFKAVYYLYLFMFDLWTGITSSKCLGAGCLPTSSQASNRPWSPVCSCSTLHSGRL